MWRFRFPLREHIRTRSMWNLRPCRQGSYAQITRVNEAVARWIHDNGYEYDGASFCIYHVSPHDTSDPEKMVTEVCYPVRKK